jgi:acyl carrier protein
MTEPELYTELTQIFRAVFADDDIVLRPETTADDVEGWDSFTHLNLMIAVEMHFGIKLRTTEVDDMANVADLAKVILSRAEART